MSRIRRKAGWLGVMLAMFTMVVMPAAGAAGLKQDPGHAIKFPDGGPIAGDPDEPGPGSVRLPTIELAVIVWLQTYLARTTETLQAYGHVKKPH